MIYVAPYYLSLKTLPYAADVFLHKNLTYFLPTGFTPIEAQSILDFPEYCRDNKIALPSIYWRFCSLYFNNSELALDAINLLKPLHESKNMTYIATIYPRDTGAIQKAAKVLSDRPEFRQKLLGAPLELDFVSREMCSHLLYEVFLEKGGYEGVVVYLKHYMSQKQILNLLSAVLLNRLQVLSHFTPLLVFDEPWGEIFQNIEHAPEIERKAPSVDDVDILCSRLFHFMLDPIYGKCDSLAKNKVIARTNTEKESEIRDFLEVCKSISTDFLLLQSDNQRLKETKLSQMLRERVTQPLSTLLDKPKQDTKRFVARSLASTAVISAALSSIIQPNVFNIGISLAAGTVSATITQIVEQQMTAKNPTRFLVTSLRRMKAKNDMLIEKIADISKEL
jgi:hypothetical protein